MADARLSTKQRVGFASAPLALIGALVAALSTNDSAHEGRRYTPYYDSASILTVCAGITGSAVVKGKRYTDDECTRLETAYVQTMLRHKGQCVGGEFEFHEIKAWGHFACNIGTPALCASTAAKRLNAAERQAACTEMWKWRYATIAGAKASRGRHSRRQALEKGMEDERHKAQVVSMEAFKAGRAGRVRPELLKMYDHLTRDHHAQARSIMVFSATLRRTLGLPKL